ncbi:hypothetical protein RND81_05G228300 [Saponaria officinalis]|uniref:HIT domain-containing protein n=1 Tax=Saponaria officinalis TaxID=3572 RepID=A0AAW1KZS9_SAPOF
MEDTQRRRIAVLCSHLQPCCTEIPPNSQFVSSSICSSSAESSNNEQQISGNTFNFQKDCIFCQIIQGLSPAFKLYEDDICLCILDTNPLSRGHCLLIPKLHCCSLDATPPSVIAATCSKIPFISSAVKKATGCDSFNLLVNNGAASGQVIFHTHIHIIPRKPRDRLWASESLRRLSLKLDNEASQLAESIRAQLSDGSNSRDCQDNSSNSDGNCKE